MEPSNEPPLDASVIPPEPRSVLLRSGSSSRIEHRQRLHSWLEDHVQRCDHDQPSNHTLSSPGVHDEENDVFDAPQSGVNDNNNNSNNNHGSSRGACDNQSSHGSSLFDSGNDGSQQQQQRISLSETKNHAHSSHSRQSIDDLLSDEGDPCNSKKSHTAPASVSTPTPPAVPDREDDDADTVQYSPNSTPREEQDDDASTIPYNPTSPSTHNDDEVNAVPCNPIHSTTSKHDQPAMQQPTPLLQTKTSTPPPTSLFDSFDDDDLFDDEDTNDININHHQQQQQNNHIQGIACSPNSGSLNLSDLEEEEEGDQSSRKKLSQQPLQRFFSVTTNNSPLSPSSLSFIPMLNNHQDNTLRRKSTEDDIFSSMSSLSTAKSFSSNNNSPMSSRQYPTSLAFTPSPFAKKTIDHPIIHTIPTTSTSPSYSSSSSSLRPHRYGLSRRSRGQQPSLFDVSKGLEQSTSQSTCPGRKKTRLGLRPPPPSSQK